MLRRLYDWTLALAARETAEIWLAIIAFIESSVFLVPADVLFVPMTLARPKRAYRFAAVATIASTLGGIAGYLLGYMAFEAVAKPVLDFYGKFDDFEKLKACAGEDTLMLLLVTSGLSHLPPIKVVTILAGVAQVSFLFFVVSCIVARGARFFALGWAIQRFGDPVRRFIEERLGLLAAMVAAVAIALYVAVKYTNVIGSMSTC
jgi:membrane protein YqaA with SNARE-associated domain